MYWIGCQLKGILDIKTGFQKKSEKRNMKLVGSLTIEPMVLMSNQYTFRGKEVYSKQGSVLRENAKQLVSVQKFFQNLNIPYIALRFWEKDYDSYMKLFSSAVCNV